MMINETKEKSNKEKKSELDDESSIRYSPAVILTSSTLSQEVYDSASLNKEDKKSPLVQNSTFTRQKKIKVKEEELNQKDINSNSCCMIS